MAHIKMKVPYKIKPFKYEMTRRKEQWKKINDPLEKQIMIPLEAQSEVVSEIVSKTCYINLTGMLNLPELKFSKDSVYVSSAETIIPYIPAEEDSIVPDHRKTLESGSKVSLQSTLSRSTASSQYESTSISNLSVKTITDVLPTEIVETLHSSEQQEVKSEFVEVEKKIPLNRELMLKHKAILKFLGLPETEAATWRVKEAKDVSELSEMTLEEQGDFLINKIAVDFCEWMRKLGGDEKSFISEDILKELFQIGMDNPASRAICIQTREKRVLYYKLAEFLQVPEKSFHEVLSLHLKWDAMVEQLPSKLVAFGKSLPKDYRFKTPKNKTAETWLEWNKLTDEQLSFADVYSSIKDLRSTKEYCKWLASHPEHKKPQYLVDQGVFARKISDAVLSKPRGTGRLSTVSTYSLSGLKK